MDTFKVGDKVRIRNDGPWKKPWAGLVGTVTETDYDSDLSFPVRVSIGPLSCVYDDDELERVAGLFDRCLNT